MILQYSNPRDFLTIDRDPASTVSAKSSGFEFVSYFDIRISDSRDKDMKSNSTKLRQLLKEPLLHFLLIGAALFLINGLRKAIPRLCREGRREQLTPPIVVTLDDIVQMVALFTRTWQRPPTEEEPKGSSRISSAMKSFYREALAIGLDRDDECSGGVYGRRWISSRDISSLAEPTDETSRLS